ncbi:MAG TPA: shikimate kinase [Bryobacteraceae bacterium]|nr:shikimate kinase [Bryobacteraceae bacterium]
MLLKLKRTPGIYLVGFMASGKSTVGRALAHELGWNFCDLDEDIEAAQGTSIAAIFDERGEEEFRKIEHQAVKRRVEEIQRGKPTVIALGGGAFIPPANQMLLTESGVPIWLDCPLERVRARLNGSSDRPLARDPEKFEQLYRDRSSAYAKADYRIAIDCDDPAEIVAAILNLPIF